MCVLRQANSLIDPRQGQSSGASCWQCCVGYARSSEEQTPSVFPTQTTAVFWGLSSFTVAVSFSKMLKSLKMSHHHCSVSAAPFCVFTKPGLDMFRGAKNTPQTCGDNTACAHNCECLQAYCEEFWHE